MGVLVAILAWFLYKDNNIQAADAIPIAIPYSSVEAATKVGDASTILLVTTSGAPAITITTTPTITSPPIPAETKYVPRRSTRKKRESF